MIVKHRFVLLKKMEICFEHTYKTGKRLARVIFEIDYFESAFESMQMRRNTYYVHWLQLYSIAIEYLKPKFMRITNRYLCYIMSSVRFALDVNKQEHKIQRSSI